MTARWVELHELRISSLRPTGPLPDPPTALLSALETDGQWIPIWARSIGSGYEIVQGVLWWLAAQSLGLPRVWIEVDDTLSDAAVRTSVAIDGAEQVAVDPITQAERWGRALALDPRSHGAVTRLAGRVGVRRPVIAHALRLLQLPASVQQRVRDGRLSAGHARALVRLAADPNRCAALARQALFERWSVRALEAAVRGESPNTVASATPAVDSDTRRLERTLSEALGCSVSLSMDALTLEYGGNLDVLDGVLARLGIRL